MPDVNQGVRGRLPHCARATRVVIFRNSREISAPPSTVFAAFEDPERLALWWGPAGFSNAFDTFEFAPGRR